MAFERAPEDRDVGQRLGMLIAESGGVEILRGVEGFDQSAFAGTEAVRLTLDDVFRISQERGREILSAEEGYLLSAISLLQTRHLWGPRLFGDIGAAISGDGDDGHFDHAVDLISTLRAARRLPYGGEVEARWIVNAADQLRETATEDYTQSSQIVLSANLPLLRGAGMVAREDLIQGERNLVYSARDFERFRRQYLVSIARDYFELLQTRASILNTLRQLESLREFHRGTVARVEAGRIDAFQRDITENQLRSAESSLQGQYESAVLQLKRFKVRIGLPLDEQVELVEGELPVPEPNAGVRDAVDAAMRLRLDLQNSRDQLEDQRRLVRIARDNLRPDLDLSASVGVPTDPDEDVGGLAPDIGETTYSVGVTMSLPLDRYNERLTLRGAQIGLERAERDHEQLLDDVVVNVSSALRNIELARFQLDLAERQVEINRRRLRGQRLQEDTIRPQDLVDTENALLDAENARDRARTNLRNAVLNYLLETDQLRVARDGTLRRLPGME
ncbi:MAG TPA: TolC family protein [Phycisphaerales bacterium]|nr:TolC family protein [Phycisphaerales bacterium]